MKKNITKKLILICFGITLLDFAIRIFISSKMTLGTFNEILGGLITVSPIKTSTIAFGNGPAIKLEQISIMVFQLLFVLLFVRIQKLEINKLFKYATTLIVFGWLGNYLDQIFLARGIPNYQHLDYFKILNIGSFTNISTILVLVGWVLLIFAVVIGFKDLKIIFRK